MKKKEGKAKEQDPGSPPHIPSCRVPMEFWAERMWEDSLKRRGNVVVNKKTKRHRKNH